MTERKLPDLAELDRVERETEPDAFVPQEEMEFLWGQLRPLLDLVDGMGTALEWIEQGTRTEPQCAGNKLVVLSRHDMMGIAITALADYRRAKGGSP